MVALAVVLLLIAFAIGFAVGRTTAASITVRGPTRDPLAHPPPATDALDDEAFAAQLLVLLAAGRKIEAIRVYRERTGLGLKEARDAVEALERGA